MMSVMLLAKVIGDHKKNISHSSTYQPLLIGFREKKHNTITAIN